MAKFESTPPSTKICPAMSRPRYRPHSGFHTISRHTKGMLIDIRTESATGQFGAVRWFSTTISDEDTSVVTTERSAWVRAAKSAQVIFASMPLPTSVARSQFRATSPA